MSKHAKGTFKVLKWDEAPYQELGGGKKLTRATVQVEFEGDLIGKGPVDYLMVYTNEQSATYTGVQFIEGTLDGRQGGFALQLAGKYDGTVAKADWEVVPGFGTGGFQSLTGTGGFSASHGPNGEWTLDYDLAD